MLIDCEICSLSAAPRWSTRKSPIEKKPIFLRIGSSWNGLANFGVVLNERKDLFLYVALSSLFIFIGEIQMLEPKKSGLLLLCTHVNGFSKRYLFTIGVDLTCNLLCSWCNTTRGERLHTSEHEEVDSQKMKRIERKKGIGLYNANF